MIPTIGYVAKSASSPLEPFKFERRNPGPHDVVIKIDYCGVCHSDIHQVRNEWNNSTYPMVPGHEIVGHVVQVGDQVKKFKINDTVGVGCFVDSCRTCNSCKDHEEQFCEKHLALTYNGTEMDLKTPTMGGYSSDIVVDENYVLQVPSTLPLASVAPLLCAGITTYSPLKRFNVKSGTKVGVIGLGGLGHMAVKFAASMGAEVTVLSTSPSKESDARRLGATKFMVTKDAKNFSAFANYFDVIINTASASLNFNAYLGLLNRGGAMVIIGVPEKPMEIMANSVISNRRKLEGSLIGGIRETQEMLNYCAEKNITPEIEMIPIQNIAAAYDRTIKGDVRYRFVIDMKSLEVAL